MNKEEWESLITSPGWSAMKRYLMDRRSDIGEKLMNGSVPSQDVSEALFRCQDLKDLAETEWADIAKFYGLEPEEKESP